MKLRYQGFVLIGVPLVFELVFVALLVSTISHLEAAAAKEAHAKQVISRCDELRITMASSYMDLFLMRMNGSLAMEKSYHATLNVLNQKETVLKQLVQDDGADSKKAVSEYLRTVDRLAELLDESFGAYTKMAARLGMTNPEYVQFLSEGEYFEELNAYLQRQGTQAAQINTIYSPSVQEFQPAASRQRAALNQVILVGVIMNILVAVVLAQVLARRTILRLDRLMSNIERFAVGVLDLKPLGGNDEIAEIDGKFRQIAMSRHASDELRRSILAMVSHDMRAPLTSLRGNLTMALEKVYGDPGPKL